MHTYLQHVGSRPKRHTTGEEAHDANGGGSRSPLPRVEQAHAPELSCRAYGVTPGHTPRIFVTAKSG